jgi:hypothetical protein
MSIKDAAVNVNINAGGTNNIFGIGGIVGNIHGAGNIIDGCYYNGDMNIGMAPDTFANNASGIGGIVGKVNTSNNQGALFPNWIKNSYSSGSVNVRGDGTPREFTYVGGVLGFELQTAANSVVNVANTYSILSVTSPGTSGGIIGGKPGTDIVSVNNVALNPSVNGDYGVTRVGAFLNASSGGNYAHEALKLFSDQGTTPVTPMEGSLEDGNSASAAFLTPEFFAGLGFSTDLWDLNFSGREYKYPLLKRLGGQEYISVPEYE